MSVITAGIDEVGWGALAGPIISCVAVFREKDLALLPPGVKDSKKCTEAQRNMLYLPLCQASYDVGIGHAWPWEIDQYGASEALQLSYKRAMGEIHPLRRPGLLYVDGSNRINSWEGQQIVEPKADNKYREVSAASIIAKVFRDTIMIGYGKTYGLYNWGYNKGYGTLDHTEAMRKNGLMLDTTDRTKYIHRRLYCRNFLKTMPVGVES